MDDKERKAIRTALAIIVLGIVPTLAAGVLVILKLGGQTGAAWWQVLAPLWLTYVSIALPLLFVWIVGGWGSVRDAWRNWFGVLLLAVVAAGCAPEFAVVQHDKYHGWWQDRKDAIRVARIVRAEYYVAKANIRDIELVKGNPDYWAALCELHGLDPERVGGIYTKDYIAVNVSLVNWLDLLCHECLHAAGFRHGRHKREPAGYRLARKRMMHRFFEESYWDRKFGL